MTTIDVDFFKYRYNIDVPAFLIINDKLVWHRPAKRILDYPALQVAMDEALYAPKDYEFGRNDQWLWDHLKFGTFQGEVIVFDGGFLSDPVLEGTVVRFKWYERNPTYPYNKELVWVASGDMTKAESLADMASYLETNVDAFDTVAVVNDMLVVTAVDTAYISTPFMHANSRCSVQGIPSLVGRNWFITAVDTGSPAPTTTLTQLEVNGVDVLSQATGSYPQWAYTVPDSQLITTIFWKVTADNGLNSNSDYGYDYVGVGDTPDHPNPSNLPPFTSTFRPSDLITDEGVSMYHNFEDMTKLFQDYYGTVPVTDFGQLVGRVQDKYGNDLLCYADASKPVYIRKPQTGVRQLMYNFGSMPDLKIDAAQVYSFFANDYVYEKSTDSYRYTGDRWDEGYWAGWGSWFEGFPADVVSGEYLTISFKIKFWQDDPYDEVYTPWFYIGAYNTSAWDVLIESYSSITKEGVVTPNDETNVTTTVTSLGDGVYSIVMVAAAPLTPAETTVDFYAEIGFSTVRTRMYDIQFEVGQTPTAVQQRRSLYDVTEPGVTSCYGLDFQDDNRFMYTSGSAHPNASPYLYFAVGCEASVAASGIGTALYWNGGDSNIGLHYNNANAMSRWRISGGSWYTSSIAMTTFPGSIVMSQISDLTAPQITTRNVLEDTSVVSSTNILFSNFGMGYYTVGRIGGGGSYFDGVMYELFSVPRKLTVAEEMQLEGYIMSKTPGV